MKIGKYKYSRKNLSQLLPYLKMLIKDSYYDWHSTYILSSQKEILRL